MEKTARKYFNTSIDVVTYDRLKQMAQKSHRSVGRMLDYIIERIYSKYKGEIESKEENIDAAEPTENVVLNDLF